MFNFIILLSLFFNNWALGRDVPETIVEISIYDLIRKQKRKYRLPKDYGMQVAKLIVAQRINMRQCLGKKSADKKILAKIQISSNGMANIKILNQEENEERTIGKINQCIHHILKEIRYPKHKLTRQVSIRLPIRIKGEVL